MIYRFNGIPNKILVALFFFLQKVGKISKCFINDGKPRIAKLILRKKNKAGVLHFLILKYITKQQYYNNVVLALKQTHRSMELNRELRKKIMHTQSVI